ncbi:hypothetical protein CONLIGDRAFT_6774 [Coniochaeta ligniaria NRRL 30616]|uniref:REJ domain-containing protein n=1 Tax=Coniochaeta ligniaria NRRL 30616 TaxID=1408157 RepID=A0A1J7JM57_9PEZI|nr:hypothetical protein CONLIGDRAFT_6774 [Coniochaeta ligniaria NRRL 30616]
MASNSQSRFGGDGNTQQSWQQRQSRVSEIAASHHRRNDGQSPASLTEPRQGHELTRSESWVELASQPSSSSLSSIGDEIVTTGLRVGNNSYPPRRRRLQHAAQNHMPSTYIVSHAAAQAGTSSQEEYDETESEEDHILSSSNEQLSPSAPLPRQQTALGPAAAASSDTDDDGSDDENSTALGVGRPSTSSTFRPQPNAFSHPPSHLHRNSTSSAVPQQQPSSSSRPSMAQRAHTRPNRGSAAPNFMSPSYQADNDAALRASLTTLLSCARALPKKESDHHLAPPQQQAGASTQPMNLRFAPESELMGGGDEAPPGPSTEPPQAIPPRLRQPAAAQQPPLRTASNSSAPSAPSSTSSRSHEAAPAPSATEKSKRAATPSNARAKSPRAAKKKRTASPTGVTDTGTGQTTSISPSVLTWVVSAGVLVLVSVVGFGAGYVIGREVGRQEGAAASLGGFGVGGDAAAATAQNASSCGREVIRSSASGGTLRRFKWGVGRSVVA